MSTFNEGQLPGSSQAVVGNNGQQPAVTGQQPGSFSAYLLR